MGGWWVADVLQNQGPAVLLAWVGWVIGSIVLHELSHGWAALACGDDTPRLSGHMTLNPVVHMGRMSLLLFALVGIAFGAMPVNPARFRGRWDEALVAFAGPMMNVLLGTGAILLNVIWIAGAGGYWFHGVGAPAGVYHTVQSVLALGAMLNITMAVFNLLPVPPLDGWRIASTVVPSVRSLLQSEGGRVVVVLVMAILFMQGGGVIFGVAMRATHGATDALLRQVAPGAI